MKRTEPIIIETPQPPIRQRDDALQVLGQAREALPSDMRDGWLVDAVRLVVRERDEARQQRDNLRGNYGDVCALVASAKRILGATEDEDIEQVAERVTRERDDVRLILDASAGETTADAATRLHNDWVDARERAEKAERERDEARDLLAGGSHFRIVESAAHVRREQCLVTRAVEANVDIRVCEDDGGGFMVGVHAPGDDEDLERNVDAADVPATLARLLGEVTREAGEAAKC